MEFTAHELWSRILARAQEIVTPQSYRTWLEGTEAVGASESELIIEGPSQFHIEWVEDKFGTVLTDVTRSVVGRPLRLVYRAGPDKPALEIPEFEVAVPTSQRTPEPDPQAFRRAANLSERYTFDRFVVGSGNDLAAAASRAVAEQPAVAYNPLFLYGGVGLGKTHLMHAIGNEILASNPTARVCYVSTEQFTNELVSAIQDRTTQAFRARYRPMDLLLVDDIQFLLGKERTQEEFFHTFNTLHDGRKQIVLTSDRPPKELAGLEERLVSRFEWGLVADIKPPDYETRVAILRKKADDDRLALDPDVIDFVARSCTASVRELEGAIIKLLAYSSLTHSDIDSGLARRALQGTIGRGERRGLTPERVRARVAEEWGVEADALASKRRTRDLTVPRQVAMFLIRELLDEPLVRIGSFFGDRDHSTVIHSIRKVEEDLGDDVRLLSRVSRLRDELSQVG